MNFSGAPGFTPIPFAQAGSRNVIPETATGAAASYTDGFPPETFLPIGSGGTPPDGKDFNGIFYAMGLIQQYAQAGGTYQYNSTFSTAIAGYPKGAMLQRADGQGYWLNLTDGNTTNPDTGGSGWSAVRANLGTSSIAMVTGTNTPALNVLAAGTLVLTGSLASAATLRLPLTAGGSWIVYNGTTGAGAVSVGGATGAAIAVPQDTALHVFTDGINFYAIAAPTTGSYLPINGTAVAATKLATSRVFSISGLATASGVNFNGTANVVLNVTDLNVPEALGYTPANDSSVVHKSGTETITGAKTFSATLNGAAASFSGTLTCLTMNATGSDRRLKRNIRQIQPRALHRELPFVRYTMRRTGATGFGVIAQDVLLVEPAYVTEFELDTRTYLAVDKASLAYEQAMWAGREIDRLRAEVDKLRHRLDRTNLPPAEPGLLRRLIRRFW